jgi:hypothetical protein
MGKTGILYYGCHAGNAGNVGGHVSRHKALLAKYDANAITINCLGGFYGKSYSRLSLSRFHELNNEGLVGACEADVRSTATMTTFTALTQGRPGYIF